MNKVTLIQGHVLPILQSLAAESVQMVCTSPPYWGLRDYGLEAQVWGGGAGCGHEWGDGKTITRDRQHLKELGERLGCLGGNKHSESSEKYNASTGQFCRLCGAWRGSYGLEPTIELYVEHTVAIFREVRRVLRKDGVLFLNLGDSYSSSPAGNKTQTEFAERGGRYRTDNYCKDIKQASGLKPKDLCMIPARVALALQSDGWWLRSDIIWAKGNPMPQSVTDRPSTSHEYIFLLTKSAKYYFDAEAIREPVSGTANLRGKKDGSAPSMDFKMQEPGKGNRNNSSFQSYMKDLPPENGRNCRSVWNINSAPFPQAHFATFPPAIPERCIKAGTSEAGCCSKCGSPYKRVVEKKEAPQEVYAKTRADSDLIKSASRGKGSGQKYQNWLNENPSTTTGWPPTCTCEAGEPIPCTVLDIFSGAGTTALVAAKLGRDAIGIELNPSYVTMSVKRIKQEMGMLVDIEVLVNVEVAP